MSDPSGTITKDTVSSILNNLERVTEGKFFFLFSAFVFAMDCSINFLTDKNLYTIGTGINFATLDWGKFLVFLLTFSFLMAFAWKLMYAVMRAFISTPAFSLIARARELMRSEEAPNLYRRDSEKYPQQAMQIALDRGDSLLYEVAKTELKLYSEGWHNKVMNAQMAFSTLCFMILDRFVCGDAVTPTLLRQFSIWSEHQVGITSYLVYGFWGVVIFVWVWEAFIDEVEYARVYVPNLK